MPSKSLAKIKSEPKRYAVVIIACIAIVIAAIVCTSFSTTGGADVPAASYRLSLSGGVYNLTTAVTEAEQEQGLGDRDGLPPTEGMLFWNADTAQRCFWMKDMRFSIDMLWVGHDKKVVKIEHSVSPDTYPQTYCADAQYVIELHAGAAAKEHIVVGRRLQF